MLPALAGNPAKHDVLVSVSEPVRRLDAVGRYDCPALMPQFPEDCQLRRIVDLPFLRVNDDAGAPSPSPISPSPAKPRPRCQPR